MSAGKAKEVKESCKAKKAQRHEASPLEYTQTHMHTHKDSLTHTHTNTDTDSHTCVHTH